MTSIPPLPAHFRVMRLEDADWDSIDTMALFDEEAQVCFGDTPYHYLLTVERPEDGKHFWAHTDSSAAIGSIDGPEAYRPNVSLALHCRQPPTLEQIEAMQRLSGLCHSLWLAASPREKWACEKCNGTGFRSDCGPSNPPCYAQDCVSVLAVDFAGLLLLPEEWTAPLSGMEVGERAEVRRSTNPAHILDLYEQAQAAGMECYLGGEA